MYWTPTLNWTQSQPGEDNLFLNVTILPVADQSPVKSATPTLNWTQSQPGEDNLFLNVTILPVADQLCCVVVEAQRTKLNTLFYISKHIIV